MVCLLWFLNHLFSHVPLKRSEISHKEVATSTRWSSIQLLVNSFGSKSFNPAMRYKCILIRQYSTLAWFNRTIQLIPHRFLFVIEKLDGLYFYVDAIFERALSTTILDAFGLFKRITERTCLMPLLPLVRFYVGVPWTFVRVVA